jgi:Pyruvate/2-oxoacid:ferredoxin oxidoreductase gamma subunit
MEHNSCTVTIVQCETTMSVQAEEIRIPLKRGQVNLVISSTQHTVAAYLVDADGNEIGVVDLDIYAVNHPDEDERGPAVINVYRPNEIDPFQTIAL